MAKHSPPSRRGTSTITAIIALILLNMISLASAKSNTTYITGTDANGVSRTLADNRDPALYTGDFDDCMGGESLLNVTRFDAAYYADNMTVSFHLYGLTNLKNESIMMYISVFAYGEDRFDMTFNPCLANINSVPIAAGVPIPVSTADVAGIPAIALVIPDFEGYATLRLYANSTQTQIGCFQAVMTNGVTVGHASAIGSGLAGFTLIAIVASFATAVYGVSVPHMRTHHAHALSVLVIFEVFHSIFFLGALSVRWPAVLPAFWSNFAWSAGMVHVPAVTSAVNGFLGTNQGNSSQVGDAGSSVINNNGGQQIYGRRSSSIVGRLSDRSHASVRRGEQMMSRIVGRDGSGNAAAADNPGYSWAGTPLKPGLPAPGEWSSFAGTLSDLEIPATDAFLTGLIWFMILLAGIIVAVVLFKLVLEALAAVRWIRRDRLSVFRSHWLGFLGLSVMRTCLIAFFMMMTLSLYQVSSGGSGKIVAIAIVVFILFFVGLFGVAAYACFFRLRFGRYESSPDRIHFRRGTALRFLPVYSPVRASQVEEGEKKKNKNNGKQSGGGGGKLATGSLPFFRVRYVDNDNDNGNGGARKTVHDDVDYTKRFGWLTAHYRRTRWWYFALWLVYQFVRACFVGGAANPSVQVYGLLVVEMVAAVVIVSLRPFEGRRNTALAVYMLSLSKVLCTALCVAFLPEMRFARIPATVFGFIIVVVQGLMAIALLVLVALSAVSSYMSLTRNREDEGFRPRKLAATRFKYFAHLERTAPDLPPPPPPVPEEPREPYFSVKSVRRAPKIEDEDDDFLGEILLPPNAAAASNYSLTGYHGGGGGTGNNGGRDRAISVGSRANSMRSTYSGYGSLPYGARAHRASWSSRDFSNWQAENVGGGSGVGGGGISRPASGAAFARTTQQQQQQQQGTGPTRMGEVAGSLRAMGSRSELRSATPGGGGRGEAVNSIAERKDAESRGWEEE